MKKIKIAIGIFLIFFLGTLVGSIGTGLVIKNKFARLRNSAWAEKQNYWIKSLTRKLDLTESQQAQIRLITQESRREVLEVTKNYRPQLKRLLFHRFQRIEETLDDEQKKKWDTLKKEYANKWK